MARLESLSKLTARFSALPGIGPKSAMRLTYHILDMPAEDVKAFAEDMYRARMAARLCKTCGNLTEDEICSVCSDDRRETNTICVVRDSRDVVALERVKEYNGVYHVLGGVISPLDGIGPDDIAIPQLLSRLSSDVAEVILATNPDVTGEATAVYLSRLIKPMGIKVTRIAHGVPIGGELEFTDEVTLLRALEGRRQI